MESIENVQAGEFALRPAVLSTTGISPCIAVISELQDGVFLLHADPAQFLAEDSCAEVNARQFLMGIFNRICQEGTLVIVKHVYLVGGWSNSGYMRLRKCIDVVRVNAHLALQSQNTAIPDLFDIFVNSIQLNLIGFNTPTKKAGGSQNLDENDDDSPDDYVFDSTMLYDRSSIPPVFAIWQYGGRDFEMASNRSEALLRVVYLGNTTTHELHAYMQPSAQNQPHNVEFHDQVLFNVGDPSRVHASFNDHGLNEMLDNLSSRIEQAAICDDD